MFKPGDIISYLEMCAVEGVNLQRGMNFRLGKFYSVILMSLRVNAPYADRIEEEGKILIYEGHDIPRYKNGPEPKSVSQPQYNSSGSLTQNGMFFEAAQKYKFKNLEPELVRVYEKIRPGIWAYNGLFLLIDSWIEKTGLRNVFKFKLKLIDQDIEIKRKTSTYLEHERIIPSSVKLKVWKRDKGKCVICGKADNLHFDHIIPYVKGGSSLVAENIQLLCARHNLEKRDKIE